MHLEGRSSVGKFSVAHHPLHPPTHLSNEYSAAFPYFQEITDAGHVNASPQ
jgi:hypothetical protein